MAASALLYPCLQRHGNVLFGDIDDKVQSSGDVDIAVESDLSITNAIGHCGDVMAQDCLLDSYYCIGRCLVEHS